MIPVQITQTQEENDNSTMALPFLDTFLVPQIPEKKMSKKTLAFGKKYGPTHELRPVNEHVRGENTFVTTHMRKMKIRKQGDKKESKTNNSNRKKTGKAKHGAFPKLEDDYKNKGDALEARSMYLEQLRELARGNKK
jgi:hypothetical protein